MKERIRVRQESESGASGPLPREWSIHPFGLLILHHDEGVKSQSARRDGCYPMNHECIIHKIGRESVCILYLVYHQREPWRWWRRRRWSYISWGSGGNQRFRDLFSSSLSSRGILPHPPHHLIQHRLEPYHHLTHCDSGSGSNPRTRRELPQGVQKQNMRKNWKDAQLEHEWFPFSLLGGIQKRVWLIWLEYNNMKMCVISIFFFFFGFRIIQFFSSFSLRFFISLSVPSRWWRCPRITMEKNWNRQDQQQSAILENQFAWKMDMSRVGDVWHEGRGYTTEQKNDILTIMMMTIVISIILRESFESSWILQHMNASVNIALSWFPL